MMKQPLVAVAIAAMVASHALAGAGIENLALGRDVTLASGVSSGAALSTLTDGVFRPSGTHWQNGTVWWGSVTTVLEIDLGGTVEVMVAIVQADNNDTNRTSYRDLATGDYLTLWTIGAVGGAGMRTRPKEADNGQVFSFDGSAFTDLIRIGAIGGDNAHSLSEVQAWGVIPAPGALPVPAIAGLSFGRTGRPRA
jgi:hypothetical protein